MSTDCQLDPCASANRGKYRNAIRLEKGQIGKVVVDFGSRNKLFEAFLKACGQRLRAIVFIDIWGADVDRDSYLWCYLNKNGHPYLQSSSEKTSVSNLWLKELTSKDKVLKKLHHTVEFNKKNIFWLPSVLAIIIFKVLLRHSHSSTWAADCSNNYHS